MLRALLIISAILFSGYAFSNEAEVDEKSYIKVESLTPCSSWTRLDPSAGNGYACSWRGYRMSIADGNDVVSAIRDIENQISQLQTTIANMQRQIDQLQNQ